MRADPADLDTPGCRCPDLPLLYALVAGRWASMAAVRARIMQPHPIAATFTAPQLYRLAGATSWAIACPVCRHVYIGGDELPDAIEWATPSEVVIAPEPRFL